MGKKPSKKEFETELAKQSRGAAVNPAPGQRTPSYAPSESVDFDKSIAEAPLCFVVDGVAHDALSETDTYRKQLDIAVATPIHFCPYPPSSYHFFLPEKAALGQKDFTAQMHSAAAQGNHQAHGYPQDRHRACPGGMTST